MKKRILLVDDDEVMLWALQRIMEDEGYEVVTTGEGNQAIGMAITGRPDLVLLDLGLPTVSGMDVLRELHRLLPVIPIVIVTSYSAKDFEPKTRELGATAFYEKTADIQVLRDMVRNLLGPA